MKKKSYFISCKEIGCQGSCSSFKNACQLAEYQTGNYENIDEKFIRIKGDNQCWIENHLTEEE